MSAGVSRTKHVDIYAVTCWRCSREVQLSAIGHDSPCCPVCEVVLVIEWPGNGQAIESEGVTKNRISASAPLQNEESVKSVSNCGICLTRI